MPRKRKSLSLSPQRKPLNLTTSVTPSSSAALPLPPAMSHSKKETLASMCEMFPNLDPSLVEMVLSEYTEVETVMDYLLELSTSAKEESELQPTGFEHDEMYIDGFQANDWISEDVEPYADQIEECFEDFDETTADLDVLLDEALDRYGLRNAGPCSVSEASASGVMSDLIQSVPQENTWSHAQYMEETAQSLDYKQESLLDVAPADVTDTVALDNLEVCLDTPDIQDCSVQQPTNSQVSFITSDNQECPQSLAATSTAPSAASKSQIKWNPLASVFYPASISQGSFITPVVSKPAQWTNVVRTREPGAVISSNAHVPSTSVWNQIPQTVWSAENVKHMSLPKTRPQPGIPVPKKGHLVGNVLILLRGAPGSGKSTLARMLLEQNPTGIILSTDDYFFINGQYRYNINCLSEAHDWNHKRAEEALKKSVSPIIIDNTNMQGWEMKPYVSMALKYKYKVTFREPDTWWKYKPKELERRNLHGVKKEKILRMLEHFERVTVSSILNSTYRKESESSSSSSSQQEDDDKNGASYNSSTQNKDAKLFIMPESESINTSDTDVAAANDKQSLVSEVVSSNPEIVLDAIKSIKQNQDITDNKSEKCADLIQRLEDISTDDRQYSDDNEYSGLCPLELATDKEDTSKVDMLSQLRPELLSFVGDWPVEQTLHQRAPRRKKHKLKSQSVQQHTEENNIDSRLEEIVDEPRRVPLNESAAFVAKDSPASQNLETSPNVYHTSLNDNTVVANVKPKNNVADSAVDTFFKILQDPQCVRNPDKGRVKSDTEITPKSSRRSCRQCKLALTFNNQRCSGVCQSSQTEPYEFAIAWRVEKNKNIDVIKSLKILTGKSVRFKSKSLEVSDVLRNNIPYRMVHHKSTFVEEDEMSSITDEDGLQILCKLFRSLSFDVLKDLFERCNKNLEWATNLLLDSGEKMYRDDEYEPESWFGCQGESCEHSKSTYNLEEENINYEDAASSIEMSALNEEQNCNFKIEATNTKDNSENDSTVNTVPLVVAEELKNGNVLSSSEVPSLSNPCTDGPLHEHGPVTDTVEAHIMWSSSLEGGHLNSPDVVTNNILNEINSNGKNNKVHITQGTIAGDVSVSYETGESSDEIPKALASKDEENTDVQCIIEEKAKATNNNLSHPKESLKFDYLELSLPPEFAFQLTELFGPVGIDPGALTIEDCVVPVDLKLAEAIHKKWKESIMERHNQEALSYQLLAEADCSPNVHINLDRLLQEQESRLAEKSTFTSQGERTPFPFLDQWNTQIKKVSLRQIMSEEMALQAHEDLKKSISSANCAVKMKEKQLLELFPNVEQNLLKDIFKESNYSLEKTEAFMSSLLESDPVQNVVAPGYKPEVMLAADRTKEKKMKADKDILCERYFQDLEFPEYDDFRAEAFLYRKKQQESYKKAAEAHNRGMKQVAAFYAQQGYLYGQKMKEEHHRAAVLIFERANEYLLPENILDLHGLHVDEAMKHFRKVLQDKAEDYKQNGGKPHLLVITGRGNRSQGGVPRIKPAVIDYLMNHNYRYQEKTSGVLHISLKKI